jgi:hypothetical protein
LLYLFRHEVDKEADPRGPDSLVALARLGLQSVAAVQQRWVTLGLLAQGIKDPALAKVLKKGTTIFKKWQGLDEICLSGSPDDAARFAKFKRRLAAIIALVEATLGSMPNGA